MPIDAKQPYDEQNIFARILRGEIPNKTVMETEHSLAFHDINPLAPIHVLVIPKGPYVSWDDFSATASDAEIGDFVRTVGEVARMTGADAQGYRILANSGKRAGQEVAHLHVHVFGGAPLGPMLSR
jgi:diadenosine tetraphosphate (Ap4A) HIT family hydrolase